MPFLIENIQATVISLIIICVIMTAGFVLVTVRRRASRRRYFQELDRARQLAQELVEPLYHGAGDVETVVASLRSIHPGIERHAMEQTLLGHTKVPEHLALTRQVLQKAGWIREWSDVLRCRVNRPDGRLSQLLAELGDNYLAAPLRERVRLRMRASFLARCAAAEKLTRVPTPEGLLALLAGTADRHQDVQEVCVRNLGRLADPATLPLLIEELIKVIEGRSPQSVRNLKTALVRFALEDVDAFRDALQHKNRRVRFFATDIIRQIADRRAATEVLGKNDFSPEIYRLFTQNLYRDEWGDVRARAALVIGHFHDSASNSILQKLLQDEAWFVRLHACRAAAGKFFLPLAPDIVRRITDGNWLVREAAVRSLLQMGEFGAEHMIRMFFTSEDRYAAEQICDQIQRSGMLSELLAQLGHEEQRRQATMVVAKMVSLGKVTMLLAYLLSPVAADLKLMLIRELGARPTAETLQTLRRCAEQDPDERVRTSAMYVCQAALSQTASASSGGN